MVQQGRRLKTSDVANSLNVSERTLRSWKKNYLENKSPKIGRPTRKLNYKLRLLKLVKEEWLRQGRPGWRPVAYALKGESVDLIQKYVSQLKMKERKVQWQYKRNRSKNVDVLFSNVVWTQDATFLKENKKRTYAEVIKDRCSFEIIEAKQVDSMNSENVKSILKDKEMPLVYMSDNGSAYCSKEMESFLKSKRVIHLKSLPATPQHNGGAEIAVKELKRLVTCVSKKKISLDERLDKAKRVLNRERLWRAHGYKTAYEKFKSSPLKDKEDVRDKLYAEYENKLCLLINKKLNKRKQRLEERELVFSLLEKYKLIKRYRGSRKYCV